MDGKQLKSKGTSYRIEVIGGMTTFMTMAYIIFIQPNILAEAGMDKEALITVTCLISCIATLIVAFLANVPFAMAPGMGLNTFFTYSLVIGMGVPWQTAPGVVFLSGDFFLLLTLVKLSFMFVDLFDSIGTIVACSHKAGLVGKD